MAAGTLDQRVTFLREVRVPDGMGGATVEWQEIATLWAMVRPMSGRERERAGRVDAEMMYTIKIRNREDITEKDIAEWRGRQFNLRAVKYAGPREHFLYIDAELGVAT